MKSKLRLLSLSLSLSLSLPPSWECRVFSFVLLNHLKVSSRHHNFSPLRLQHESPKNKVILLHIIVIWCEYFQKRPQIIFNLHPGLRITALSSHRCLYLPYLLPFNIREHAHTHTTNTTHTYTPHILYIMHITHDTSHTYIHTHHKHTLKHHTQIHTLQLKAAFKLPKDFQQFCFIYLAGVTRDEPLPTAVEARSPYHWTAREFPNSSLLIPQIQASSCFYSFSRIV